MRLVHRFGYIGGILLLSGLLVLGSTGCNSLVPSPGSSAVTPGIPDSSDTAPSTDAPVDTTDGAGTTTADRTAGTSSAADRPTDPTDPDEAAPSSAPENATTSAATKPGESTAAQATTTGAPKPTTAAQSATTTTAKPTTTTTTKPTTAATTAKPTTAQPTTQPEEYASEVLRLVNAERSAVGLQPLQAKPLLDQAALIRAKELPTQFDHTRPDGSSCFTVLDETGVSYMAAGENIAFGYSTPAAVMEGWMNSPGHRENILREGFTHLGVGMYEENGRLYWTQLFIG